MKQVSSTLILGSLPPPVGGVTISVKNLVTALTKKNVFVSVFPNGLWRRYDVAHAHNYQPWKRFAMLLLGRLVAKKVVFTIHGMHFDESNWFNKVNLWLADGVVIQNDDVLDAAPALRQLPYIKMGSLVTEGLDTDSDAQQILPDKTKPRLLVYAQHANSFEGKDIYGVPFVESMLDKLTEKYTVIVADVSDSYPHLDRYQDDKVIRLNKPVNFTQLLSEVDVYLRPTCKDGDSVAVLEAIMMGIPVVASDVVTRREEVFLYQFENGDDFCEVIDRAINSVIQSRSSGAGSVNEYLKFYSEL